MKRVFAVNGSPRLKAGSTDLLLGAVLDGMREAGAEVEAVYASKLDIRPCIGDFHCWYEVPGECVFHDDMEDVYPKVKAADILVLATPVYIPLPGAMQDFINRLCPLADPSLQTRDGRTRIRLLDDVRLSQILLVATCGWWEMGNFGTVRRIGREFAEDISVGYAELLRPHAGRLREGAEVTAQGREVLRAAGRAGRELIESGAISAETFEEVARPLISEEGPGRSPSASTAS